MIRVLAFILSAVAVSIVVVAFIVIDRVNHEIDLCDDPFSGNFIFDALKHQEVCKRSHSAVGGDPEQYRNEAQGKGFKERRRPSLVADATGEHWPQPLNGAL